MDLERFGLKDSPFGRLAASFVAVESRRESLVRLERSLAEGQGVCVLTAPSGLGKSAICRELKRRLEPAWLVVHLPDAGCTTRRALLQSILYELDLPYTGLTEQEARLQLLDAVRRRPPEAAGLILLADEAQRLNDRLLEELRSLIHHEDEGVPLVRVLLCGDGVLEERLIDRALERVNQRVVCHEILAPLSHEESAALIDGRILQAGGDGWEHVYSREAMELICRVSDGSPRNLEQLARRSLDIAAERRENLVSLDDVRTALEHLKELPLQWDEPANLPSSSPVETPVHDRDDAVDPYDDAVSVVPGDELPGSLWSDFPAAVAYEYGGESADGDAITAARPADIAAPASDEPDDSSEHHALLDDFDPQLEDTAILRHDWSPASPAPAEPASPASSGWEEFTVDDPYAVLDAEQPGAGQLIIPALSYDANNDDAAVTEHQPPADIEQQLLDDVRELARELSGAACSPGNSPSRLPAPPADAAPHLHASPWCSGFSSMPEWDVVQPEWVTDPPLEAAAIDAHPKFDAEASAPSPTVKGDARVISDEIAPNGGEGHETPAATPPAAAEIAPDDSLDDWRRHDGHRPYSQLFTRLRRLRSSVRQRIVADD